MVGKIKTISFVDNLAQLEINDCTGTASVQKWIDDTDEDAVRCCVGCTCVFGTSARGP